MARPLVFFIDDEKSILKALTRLTLDEPYDVVTFDNPRKALAELGTKEVAVVVSDMRMPEMSGTELLEKARVSCPNATRMILSGYSDINSILSAINKGEVFQFITKPWDADELKSAISEGLSRHQLITENQRLAELSERQNKELLKLNRDLEEKITQRTRKIKESEAQLKDALEGIIQAIALTVETRDPYTAGHQNRVADLACCIAEEMELSAEQIKGVRLAGLIHDLGKIYVPAEILNRPGKLTHLEKELINVHPQVGYDILKDISFPWPIAEIVYQHHERMNGKGYPRGLRGESLLLEARIIAVADVVEAMSSHRPYRPAPGITLALEEIARNQDIFYDPEVTKACLDLFKGGKCNLDGWLG